MLHKDKLIRFSLNFKYSHNNMIMLFAPICTNIQIISMFQKWGCTSIQPVITAEKQACKETAMTVTKLLFLCHLSSFSDDYPDSNYLKSVRKLLKEKGIK